jgi:tubulin polyglutamylase TTLL6/13
VHIYKTAKPQDVENQLCFQILGMDIFLDKKAKPWLIEVNQSPSFETDSPLDEKIKKNLLSQTFQMLNLNWKRKNKYIAQHKAEMHKRLTG